MLACNTRARLLAPPLELQDIVRGWAGMPQARQRRLFDGALMAAAQASWDGLEEALQLGMELEL